VCGVEKEIRIERKRERGDTHTNSQRQFSSGSSIV
jgi:hypothetical protein